MADEKQRRGEFFSDSGASFETDEEHERIQREREARDAALNRELDAASPEEEAFGVCFAGQCEPCESQVFIYSKRKVEGDAFIGACPRCREDLEYGRARQ
jgi:hypothetical protein